MLVGGTLKDAFIVEVACGANHTIVRDKEGLVFSWGFGGYGRLGHSKQEDLWTPMPIDQFAGSNKISKATKIAAGSSFSMALDGKSFIYMARRNLYPVHEFHDPHLFSLPIDSRSIPAVALGQVEDHWRWWWRNPLDVPSHVV